MYRKTALALALLAGSLALAPQGATACEDEGKEASRNELAQQNRSLAEQAQRESAASAVKSLLDATRLDLDIELVGLTSIKVAGEL